MRPANSSVVALDARSGREKWRFNTTKPDARFTGVPAATGDTVYFGSAEERRFRAVGAADGRERFAVCLPLAASDGEPAAAATPDGRTVLVAATTGLYALDTRPGPSEPCPEPAKPKTRCEEFTAAYDDPKNEPDPIVKGYVYHYTTALGHYDDPMKYRVGPIERGPCPFAGTFLV